jgi:hypothetical protein
VALFTVPKTAFADDLRTWSKRLEAGLHLGADFAGIGGSELNDVAVDYSYRAGFTGGGTCSLRLTHVLSAQLELTFATKGFRGDTSFPSTSGTGYIGYLEIPLLARFGIPIAERFEPNLTLGPALGLRLSARTTYDDGRVSPGTDRVEPIDIGLMFGTGIAIDVGQAGALTFDVRYNLGLRNWGKNATSDNEAFNRAIYLTVGYRADLATLGRLFGGSRPRGPAEPASRRR